MSDGFTQRHIDLDWRYLGLNPELAWMAFDINDAGEPDADPA